MIQNLLTKLFFMSDEFNNLPDNEKLKAENDFLKMKMMLEKGAQFGGNASSGLPAEIENEFLKNIMAFEQQMNERKTIKLFDKLGKPTQFKPANEIPDREIDKAWNDIHDFLGKHSINLDVCSPNISNRELYRFTVEELFEHETTGIPAQLSKSGGTLPGWTTNFIYDEFHPDPVYDNSKLVEQNLINDIFRKEDFFYEINFDSTGFVFNSKLYETRAPFFEMLKKFKSLFDEIEMTDCNITSCNVKETDCVVKAQ